MYYGHNRYMCDVFEEMRTTLKTMNFAILPSLIEEAQTMANRMEAGLSDINDLELLHKDISEKKKELKELNKKVSNQKELCNDSTQS